MKDPSVVKTCGFVCMNAKNAIIIFFHFCMLSTNDSFKVYIKFQKHTLEKSFSLGCIVGPTPPFLVTTVIVVLQDYNNVQ